MTKILIKQEKINLHIAYYNNIKLLNDRPVITKIHITPQLMNCKPCPNLLFIYYIGFKYYLLVIIRAAIFLTQM